MEDVSSVLLLHCNIATAQVGTIVMIYVSQVVFFGVMSGFEHLRP